MNFWTNIKKLYIEKKKMFLILSAVECILLVIGAAGMFGKEKVYHFDGTLAVLYPKAGSEEKAAEFQNISLPAGTYRVRLQYDTDMDGAYYCGVSENGSSGKNLRTNGADLYAELQSTNYEMWLLQKTSLLTVYVESRGDDASLRIQGLEICKTNAWSRMIFFGIICLFAVIDICILYAQYDKKYTISLKQKNVTFILGLTVLFSSLPLFTDSMNGGGDLVYHLMRVEGIKDGLLSGQFPIRISPNWQKGYGYASPIFYGETLLYPAALFRMIGFSIVASYRMYMLLMTVATVLVSFYCFKKVFGEAYVGAFCSMLYSLSVYRIFKTYLCGSWGETMGIMILPFLVYGFYRVFSQDVREKDYKRSWIPLTIGFTLLIQSHLLTGEMAGFFTILLCIVMIKKVFRKETFLVLAKTVVYSVLLSAWFLIPFGDYMLTGDFVIHNVSARTIQNRGLYPAHLLFAFFRAGTNVFFKEGGMAHSQPMGVGIALLAGLLIWCFLRFNGKTGILDKKEIVLGRICAGFGVTAMVMSLSLFPWDKIHSLGGIVQTLVSSIQFPNRFLTIANVCLTVLVGLAAKYVLANGKRIQQLLYVVSMLSLMVISSIFLTNDYLNNLSMIRAYNSEAIGTSYISGAEYLPYGADASAFTYHNPRGSEGVTAQNYLRRELGGECDAANAGSDKATVSFPLLYYKGYRAYDLGGMELPCYAGENFEVTVEIPAQYQGRISVQFESLWYWRAGEAISVLSLAIMVLSSCFYQKRKRKEAQGK